MKAIIIFFGSIFLLSCHDNCKESLSKESRRADSLQAILIIERESAYRVRPKPSDFYYFKMKRDIMWQIDQQENRNPFLLK
jgi:hypothetical protein